MGIRFYKPITESMIVRQECKIRVQKMIQIYIIIHIPSLDGMWINYKGIFLKGLNLPNSNRNNSVCRNLICSAWVFQRNVKSTENVEIENDFFLENVEIKNYIFSKDKENLIEFFNLIKKQFCKTFPQNADIINALCFT